MGGAEGILFAVDVDPEVGQEVAKGSTRLDIIRQCISFFVTSKRRVNPKHVFGVASVDERATLLTPGLTSSVEEVEAATQKLQPRAGHQLDLASLIDLAKGLGGGGAKVRVILIYNRSRVLPFCSGHHGQGVALDVVYIHEKPSQGVNCPQEVYNVLEEQADVIARLAGHSAYIFEASCQNHKKIFGLMVWLLAHPSTRPHQQQLPPSPLDLATAPLLPTNLPASSLSPTLGSSPTQSPVLFHPGVTAGGTTGGSSPPGQGGVAYGHPPTLAPPITHLAPGAVSVPAGVPLGAVPSSFGAAVGHSLAVPSGSGAAVAHSPVASGLPVSISGPSPLQPPLSSSSGASLLGPFLTTPDSTTGASPQQPVG